MTDCKTCSKCGQVKAVSEFYSGHRQCKECDRKQRAAWRKANPEKAAAMQAAYRKANHEKVAAKEATYRKRNPEKIAKKDAAYRKANQRKMAERQATRVSKMMPSYIAARIGLPVTHLSPELLELKREQLTLSRATNQLKKEMKNVE